MSARSTGISIASVRILRLALGTALSLWFSQAVGWQMSFIAPVFTLLVLALPLPALTVATVGGGCMLGTSRECLEILGCVGAGKAAKLAEIVAGSLLAGELSMGGAIASGEFVEAHEAYGRNRPHED